MSYRDIAAVAVAARRRQVYLAVEGWMRKWVPTVLADGLTGSDRQRAVTELVDNIMKGESNNG